MNVIRNSALVVLLAVVFFGAVPSEVGLERAEAAGVTLQSATATCSSVSYPVSETINGVLSSGWVCPAATPSTAVWETQSDITGTNLLTFSLNQTWFDCTTIGRFRLSATNADRSTFADSSPNAGDVDTTWTVLDPTSATSLLGATMTELADHSILVSGTCASSTTEIYTVKAPSPFSGITGFRLENLQDASFNACCLGGPGRRDDGVFVLTEFSVDATPTGGKLEVKKSLSPNTDAGRFDLKIDNAIAGSGANVGDGGTTGEMSVASGVRGVAEVAHAGTSLNNYASSVVCKDQNGAGSVVAGPAAATSLKVTVHDGDDIVCTFTNTAKGTGKLTVTKVLSPTTDAGKFDLRIDNAVAGTGGNVGNGGTTGAITVVGGTHTVSEVAHTGTNLNQYTKSVICKAGGGTGATVAGPASAASLQVTVNNGDDIVCVITNTLIIGKQR